MAAHSDEVVLYVLSERGKGWWQLTVWCSPPNTLNEQWFNFTQGALVLLRKGVCSVTEQSVFLLVIRWWWWWWRSRLHPQCVPITKPATTQNLRGSETYLATFSQLHKPFPQRTRSSHPGLPSSHRHFESFEREASVHDCNIWKTWCEKAAAVWSPFQWIFRVVRKSESTDWNLALCL